MQQKHSADVCVIVMAQHTPNGDTQYGIAVANLALPVNPLSLSCVRASRLTWALGYVEAG